MELKNEFSIHQIDALLRLFRCSCEVITEGEMQRKLNGEMFLSPSQESLLELMHAIKRVQEEFDW